MKYLNLTFIIFALLFTSCSDNDNDSSPKAELNGFWNGVAYSEENLLFITLEDYGGSYTYVESLAAFEIGWDNGTYKPFVPVAGTALQNVFDVCDICTIVFDNNNNSYSSSVYWLGSGTYEVDGNSITLYNNYGDDTLEIEGTFEITNGNNTQDLSLELYAYEVYDYDNQLGQYSTIFADGWKYIFRRNI
tara:strand:+ start:213 stop:782 length:570 start_codon:yes stop_codon:yes gene_type:complete